MNALIWDPDIFRTGPVQMCCYLFSNKYQYLHEWEMMQSKQHAIKLGHCDLFHPHRIRYVQGWVVFFQPMKYIPRFMSQEIVYRLAKLSNFKYSLLEEFYFSPIVTWFLSYFSPQRFVEKLEHGIVSHLWTWYKSARFQQIGMQNSSNRILVFGLRNVCWWKLVEIASIASAQGFFKNSKKVWKIIHQPCLTWSSSPLPLVACFSLRTPSLGYTEYPPNPNRISSSAKPGIHPNAPGSEPAWNVCPDSVWWICLFLFCLSNIVVVQRPSSSPVWQLEGPWSLLYSCFCFCFCFHMDNRIWMQTWLVWQDLSWMWCTVCQGSCPWKLLNHTSCVQKTENTTSQQVVWNRTSKKSIKKSTRPQFEAACLIKVEWSPYFVCSCWGVWRDLFLHQCIIWWFKWIFGYLSCKHLMSSSQEKQQIKWEHFRDIVNTLPCYQSEVAFLLPATNLCVDSSSIVLIQNENFAFVLHCKSAKNRNKRNPSNRLCF